MSTRLGDESDDWPDEPWDERREWLAELWSDDHDWHVGEWDDAQNEELCSASLATFFPAE